MASFLYHEFPENMGKATMNLTSDTLKLALLADSHTPSTADTVWTNVSGDEITGTGYTAGGKALSNQSWANTAGRTKLDADDPAWTSATFTARYAVLYDDTALNKPLIALYDLGSNRSVSNGTFTGNVHSDGLLYFDV